VSEKFDFVQTMKDWRRMCKFCSDEGTADGRHGCVDVCPIGHNNACGNIENATDRDIEEAARAIEKWAEDHPEPSYPTWMEWLTEMGAIPKAISWDEPLVEAVYDALQERIPAEIAEKLEIEPKA